MNTKKPMIISAPSTSATAFVSKGALFNKR